MLSAMAKDFFQSSPVLTYPIMGLILFVLVFSFVAWRAARMRTSEVEPLAEMPLCPERSVVSNPHEDAS